MVTPDSVENSSPVSALPRPTCAAITAPAMCRIDINKAAVVPMKRPMPVSVITCNAIWPNCGGVAGSSWATAPSVRADKANPNNSRTCMGTRMSPMPGSSIMALPMRAKTSRN